MPLTLGTNLLTNGGFENAMTGWTGTAGTVAGDTETFHSDGDGDYTAAGVQACKFTVDGTLRARYQTLWTGDSTFEHAGYKLYVRLWMKTTAAYGGAGAPTNGAEAYVQLSDGGNTYERCYKATNRRACVMHGTQDWTLMEFTTDRIGAAKTAAYFYLMSQSMADPSGYAWFDDIWCSLEEGWDFNGALALPYRGLLYAADPRVITCTADVLEGTRLAADCEAYLKVASGETVLYSDTFALTDSEVNTFSLPIAGIAAGSYTVTLQSRVTADATVLTTDSWTLTVQSPAATRPSFYYNDSLNFTKRVGGAEFLHGVYNYWYNGGRDQAADLALLADTPFGYVVNYGGKEDSVANQLVAVAAAAASGITVIQACEDVITEIGATADSVSLASRVEGLAGAAGLAGYYLSDETVGWPYTAQLASDYAYIKAADPDSIVMHAWTSSFSPYDRNRPYADIVAICPTYPAYSSGTVAGLAAKLDTLMNDVQSCRCPVAIVEAGVTSTAALPTEAQMRAMAYLALVKGCRGIIWYRMDELLLHADGEAQWASLVDVADEIDARKAYALVAPDAQQPTSSDSSVLLSARTAGETRGLLVVNVAATSKTTTLTLTDAMAYRQMRDVASDGSSYDVVADPPGYSVALTLDAYASKLYEFWDMSSGVPGVAPLGRSGRGRGPAGRGGRVTGLPRWRITKV